MTPATPPAPASSPVSPVASPVSEAVRAAAAERILVLDGGWGSMFQAEDLTESDFHG